MTALIGPEQPWLLAIQQRDGIPSDRGCGFHARETADDRLPLGSADARFDGLLPWLPSSDIESDAERMLEVQGGQRSGRAGDDRDPWSSVIVLEASQTDLLGGTSNRRQADFAVSEVGEGLHLCDRGSTDATA